MISTLLLVFGASANFQIPRRQHDISFSARPSIMAESNPNELHSNWYFVHFLGDVQYDVLKKADIHLKETNMISKNVFNLFLSAKQVNMLISNNLAELSEINPANKLTTSANSFKINAKEIIPKQNIVLTIETSDSFDQRKYSHFVEYNFIKLSETLYEVLITLKNFGNYDKLINSLKNDRNVYAITQNEEGDILNVRSAGYVQKNSNVGTLTKPLTDAVGTNIVGIERYLEKQGLNGNGTVILVVDTVLDHLSTFFYDPNYPEIEVSKLISSHRKIVYIDANPPEETINDDVVPLLKMEMGYNEHGTHTAGTTCGEALNSSSEAALYNGIAPASKLAFYSSNDKGFLVSNIMKTVEAVHPQVCSNSWGTTFSNTENAKWDQACLDYSETLFVFAAGNAGYKTKPDLYDFMTLKAPGSAKNILTVGSLEPISVDEEKLGQGNKDIYIVDHSTMTQLMKLLSWSDIQQSGNATNLGMKYLFENGFVQDIILRKNITSFPTAKEIDTKTAILIESEEEFYAMNRDNIPLLVITTFELECHNFTSLGFKHLFPVCFLNKTKFDVTVSYNYDFYTNYRVGQGNGRAFYSSKGPGELGIMKPDILAPGTGLFSAKSFPKSVNGTNHPDVTVKHGTSMATPSVSGIAAIVYQYFIEGNYRNTPLKASSFFSRSFLIMCADPIVTNNKIDENELPFSLNPNPEEGYGDVNVGKYIGNGNVTDNKHLLIGDHLPISWNETESSDFVHMVSKIKVSNSTSDLQEIDDLRIVISYLDKVLNPDSSIGICIDLDLVVVNPSKTRVYRGNQRIDNTEEQFSTNERVIVRKNEIENGEYEIHIFALIPKIVKQNSDNNNSIEFAISIHGPLENAPKFITFERAAKGDCIPLYDSKNGKCNKETTLNECGESITGHSCQTKNEIYYPDQSRMIVNVKPYGIKYVTLVCPYDAYDKITYRISPSSYFEPIFAVFTSNQSSIYDKSLNYNAKREINADRVQIKYDMVEEIVSDGSMPDVDQICAIVMIYNLSPNSTDMSVSGKIEASPTRTRPPPVPFPTSTADTSSDLSETSDSSSSSNDSDDGKKNDNGVISKTGYAILLSCCIAFALLSIGLMVFIFLKRRKFSNDGDIESCNSATNELAKSLIH